MSIEVAPPKLYNHKSSRNTSEVTNILISKFKNDNNSVMTSEYDIKLYDSAVSLLSSKLLQDWRKEIRDNDKYNDHILLSLYPRFDRVIRIVTSEKFLLLSAIFCTWTVVATIVNASYCLTYLKSFGMLLSFSIAIIPTFLLIFQINFVLTWNHQKYNSKHTLRETLCFMLNQLNDLSDGSLINKDSDTLFKIESKIFYFNFTYLTSMFCFIINGLCLVVDYNSPELSKGSCFQFCINNLGYFTSSIVSLCSSGHAVFFLLNCLYKISWVAHNLILSWMYRYQSIQRIKSNQLKYYIKNLNQSETKLKSLPSKLRRDAYERYLLIDYSLHELSNQLSGLISLIFIISFLIFIFSVYNLFVSQWLYSRTVIIWLVFSYIMFFLPMGFISYTNSAIDKVKRNILYSVPSSSIPKDINRSDLNEDIVDEDNYDNYASSDFELIGGREEWLEYISTNPLYWRVYGLAITPALLQSLFIGAITTVIISFIPILANFMT